jgi:hypothetical protein
MEYPNFDHHVNNRVYFINKGNTYWAVNDVTAARNAPASVKGAAEMMRKYPSRWVAFADTREQAIEMANKDANS